MVQNIILKAEKLFDEMISNNSDVYNLRSHIIELKKWLEKICKKYPSLDREVLFLSVYLHDIGHYPINSNEDHAITSERISRKFLLENGYNIKKAEQVLHCVRSHRCKDIMPASEEAKALAFMDSASHLTDRVYLSMFQDGLYSESLNKVERDYRDLTFYPEIKKELEPVYLSWKSLLTSLIKLEGKTK